MTAPDIQAGPVPASDARVDLKGMTLARIEAFVRPLGKERFRARQILKWIYQRRATVFAEMTDLSKDFRAELDRVARLSRLELAHRQGSDDGSAKLVWRLDDGLRIESVLIPEEGRLTLCVSTQVGCAMACRFCVTAKGGFTRNLSAAEIVNQVIQAQELSERRVSNIVLMGMGEPLLNFDAVLDAVEVVQYEDGLNFSHRKITLSTVGIVPRMRELGERSPINLAVSLHGTTQAAREALMPISGRFTLEEVLEACRSFPLPQRKLITFEYILLRGINDDVEDAGRLAKLLRGIPAKVNLIPYNPTPLTDYRRPSDGAVRAYQQALLDRGIQTSVRTTRGDDVSAACGQLGGYAQARPGRATLPVADLGPDR